MYIIIYVVFHELSENPEINMHSSLQVSNNDVGFKSITSTCNDEFQKHSLPTCLFFLNQKLIISNYSNHKMFSNDFLYV